MSTGKEVREAHEFLKEQLQPTPLLHSETIDGMVGCKVWFKSEHLQKTGSFKARGALYSVSTLKKAGCKGVITHSSGNHGQAVAWAARKNGLPCTVVVPDGAPASKVEAIKAYGADLQRCGNAITDREGTCAQLAEERTLDVVEPFNHPLTIHGQGTVGEELKEQLGREVEALFVAVGGGGLSAGLALALPHTQLYLAEPEGKLLSQQLAGVGDGDESALPTVADGIRVRKLGGVNRAILSSHAHIHTVTVSEEEIREALIIIWTRLKQRVEPTAAVAFAALRQLSASAHGALPFREAAVILCGGNVDVAYTPL